MTKINKYHFRELLAVGPDKYTGTLHEKISANSKFSEGNNLAKKSITNQIISKISDESFIIETDYKLEWNNIEYRIDIAVFKNEEAKNNNIIHKAYVFSMSAKMKIKDTVDFLFMKGLADKAEITIEDISFVRIDNSGTGNENIQYVSKYYENRLLPVTKGVKMGEEKLNGNSFNALVLLSGAGLPPSSFGGQNRQKGNEVSNIFKYLSAVLYWFGNRELDIDFINDQTNKYLVTEKIQKYLAEAKEIDFKNKEYSLINTFDLNLDKKIVFFDFETICVPVAAFDTIGIHDQTVLQYASVTYDPVLDRQISSSSEVFVGKTTEEYLEFIIEMVDSLHQSDCYYASHHNQAEREPLMNVIYLLTRYGRGDVVKKINEIISSDNLIDTEVQFENIVSAPAFKVGSRKAKSSIKVVYKWLEKNYPEFIFMGKDKSYEDLEIAQGWEASVELANMLFSSETISAEKISNLKEYCEQDVYNIISLWRFLLFVQK